MSKTVRRCLVALLAALAMIGATSAPSQADPRVSCVFGWNTGGTD